MSGVEVIDGVVADLGLVLDNERREIVLSARAGPEQLRAASVPPSRFETMPNAVPRPLPRFGR
jgi:hypothetical protein